MLGPHALKKDVKYMLGCQWDAARKSQWRELKARNGLFTPGQNAASYTAEETVFLTQNYGGESHFLMQHGLKIHSDEDREEGRAILRAVMREDEMSDDQEDDFDESELKDIRQTTTLWTASLTGSKGTIATRSSS
jgi:hypothetical protein